MSALKSWPPLTILEPYQLGPSDLSTSLKSQETRRSILGSAGMTKSNCSFSLWMLSECSLNACLMLSDSSWSHPQIILKTSWRHHEDILKTSWSLHELFMKSSWRIWGWKMKIECSRQLWAGQTDGQTEWLLGLLSRSQKTFITWQFTKTFCSHRKHKKINMTLYCRRQVRPRRKICLCLNTPMNISPSSNKIP